MVCFTYKKILCSLKRIKNDIKNPDLKDNLSPYLVLTHNNVISINLFSNISTSALPQRPPLTLNSQYGLLQLTVSHKI